MWDTILQTLVIMGWLGIIFLILVIVNTICGILCNTSKGEEFSIKKLLKGLLKALIFYISSTFTAIAFTMLPFINNLINNTFGMNLISNESLNTLSCVAVLVIVINTVVMQGKKALEGIKNLSEISINEEKE